MINAVGWHNEKESSQQLSGGCAHALLLRPWWRNVSMQCALVHRLGEPWLAFGPTSFISLFLPISASASAMPLALCCEWSSLLMLPTRPSTTATAGWWRTVAAVRCQLIFRVSVCALGALATGARLREPAHLSLVRTTHSLEWPVMQSARRVFAATARRTATATHARWTLHSMHSAFSTTWRQTKPALK